MLREFAYLTPPLFHRLPLSFSLSSGRSRDYFYLSAIVQFRFAPPAAAHHFAVEGNGDTSRFNTATT
jgi:hypothetical protein